MGVFARGYMVGVGRDSRQIFRILEVYLGFMPKGKWKISTEDITIKSR